VNESTQEPTEGKRGFSRRTVLTAAAWSVPVVMVAKAAPAFAGTTSLVHFTGLACKWPGSSAANHPKAFAFQMSSFNPNSFDVLIVIESIFVHDANFVEVARPNGNFLNYIAIDPMTPTTALPHEGDLPCADPAAGVQITDNNRLATFQVAAGQTIYWTASAGEFQDSQNAGMTITFSVFRLDTGPNHCLIVQNLSHATAESGIRSTPPCCVSTNPCPSYTA
jgi:hypothetical protein